ncbi:Alpha/beta hydrolase fold-1 [Aspergillus germanicus]
MASPLPPTIVFIPGAWHTPEYYNNVRSILEKKGYPTVGVPLPSVDGTATMGEDAAAIHTVTAQLVAEGKRVILVMHSYGGIPGTESAKGLAWRKRTALGGENAGEGRDRLSGSEGGIVALVYLAAYLLSEGMSVMSFGSGRGMPEWLTAENGMISYETKAAIANLYGDLLPDCQHKAEAWASKLKPHSAVSWAGELTYPAHRDIPATYLLCTQDRSISLDLQGRFVGFAQGDITTRTCDSAHSPMISMPGVVVDTIVEAVERVDRGSQ